MLISKEVKRTIQCFVTGEEEMYLLQIVFSQLWSDLSTLFIVIAESCRDDWRYGSYLQSGGGVIYL